MAQQTQKDANEISDRVAKEDLTLFINACFACTGQSEFYGDAMGQGVSITFLHQYILGNYRRLYARTLAAGINHFNTGLILFNLLATGSMTLEKERRDESALINGALKRLPPQRVFKLFEKFRDCRVNNRRTRAVVRDYLNRRPDPIFDAVKYRRRVCIAATHAHLRFDDERERFLFGGWKTHCYQTPIFESYRRAHHSKSAIYELPYSIAEGFAAKHRIPREQFLTRIQEKMTDGEKFRLQKSGEKHRVRSMSVDVSRAPLTTLALYILSLSREERARRRDELSEGLVAAARRTTARQRPALGKVACVLDNSFSSFGSREKRRRPLGVALGVSAILRQAASRYFSFWTDHSVEDLYVQPRGQTDLAAPLIEALALEPNLVVIVSDGYENAPTGAVSKIHSAFARRIDRERKTAVIHVNPVFDAEEYAPKSLAESIPTVGLRNAEDVLTMLGFARFAAGFAPLRELEAYLEDRMTDIISVDEANEKGRRR